MPMVASVVSNGLTPILVIATPLRSPQPAAVSIAAMTESQIGRPAIIATATVTPLDANTDPTDRSKPPDTKAIVIPVVIIRSNTSVSAIESMLARLPKWGTVKENKSPQPTTSTSSV